MSSASASRTVAVSRTDTGLGIISSSAVSASRKRRAVRVAVSIMAGSLCWGGRATSTGTEFIAGAPGAGGEFLRAADLVRVGERRQQVRAGDDADRAAVLPGDDD